MNPVVDRVARWREEDKKVAMATVVKVERSGPLGAGTSMAVSEDGQVVGSVSGGCVEAPGFFITVSGRERPAQTSRLSNVPKPRSRRGVMHEGRKNFRPGCHGARP